MIKIICDSFITQGVNPAAADVLARAVLAVLAIFLSIVANLVAKRLILKGLAHLIVRTETKWDDFLLDRASGVIFCVSPHMRGKRLKHQTAILKTLWDVSTMLRAWRLEVILKATWPRTDEPGEP